MHKSEIYRFLLVGGLNFVFTFLVFTAALKLLGIGYVFALLLAWIAGNLLTYSLNFIWVFKPETKLNFGVRFVKYLTAGALSIGMNLLALAVMVELAELDPFRSQVILLPCIVGFNFLTAKFWSLRKKVSD